MKPGKYETPPADYEKRRLAIQAQLDAAKTQAERNQMGQFATPTFLATDILTYAQRLLPKSTQIRFLDPAFGTGSFYSAFLRTFPLEQIVKATGFEIDPHYANPAMELWNSTPLELHLADFSRAEPPTKESQRFNLVICNPPYVRHHHIPNDEKPRLQRISEQLCGVSVNGLAGLYCYFLLLSHAYMATDGIAGWLIPSEFMDVNYGVALKQYLISQVTLLRIHRFDPDEVQFEDALVSSAVVWFRKTKPPEDHEVEFTFGGTLAQPKISRRISVSALDDETKWTRFPIAGEPETSASLTLGDLFTIKRGLATGDNKFFILTREQIQAHGLPMEFFRSILPSPRYLRVKEILANKDGTPRLEPQLFLLDCKLPEEDVKDRFPSLWTYLEMGKARGVHNRYLCRHRSPWYAQENRPSPMFLSTYMGRRNTKNGRPFRFILNHSDATAANVYLLMYPKPLLAQKLQANPSLAREIWQALDRIATGTMIREGRVYGGGLYKMEPKELSNVPVGEIAALLQ